MKHRDIVIEKNKFIAEIGKDWFTKKNNFFDWQYVGDLSGESPIEDDMVKLEFYWNEMSPELLKALLSAMLYLRWMETGRYIVHGMKIIGGSHDLNNVRKKGFNQFRSHQVCLEITLNPTRKY